MKDLPDSRIDEIKDLIRNLNPDKTIYYFDNQYHTVKNDWLTVISADEAEQSLRDPEFDLINLFRSDYPEVLPESCPAWMYTNISVKEGLIGEFLQMLFDAKFCMNLAEMSNDKTISKN